MPARLPVAEHQSLSQNHIELRDRCYLLHETKLQVAALQEYVQDKESDVCMDVHDEIQRLDIECSNHTTILKNAYPQLGICFIPCCDCGRVGGVLKQLANGDYLHIDKPYCVRLVSKTERTERIYRITKYKMQRRDQ